ncbi:MAG: ParB/RepB/Spo0J family partition protein [Chromatiales bacterium]
MKKRGLGRGLDALLGIGSEATDADADTAPSHDLRSLPVDLIQRGRYQPRVDMKSEALQELADSIKAQGVVQPVVVRRLPGQGRYELIAGERRWRAAQMAGLHDIPAVVRDADDKAAVSIALIENIQRADLNAIEEANALHRLVNEFDLTHQQVAEAIGRSRAAVSNLLRLLDLAEPVKRMVEQGRLEMGHARALLALPPERQVATAERIVARGLSVRQAEQLVKHLLQTSARKPSKTDPDTHRLEQELGERLGARVSFRHGAKGRGAVMIHYNSLEELDGILSHIK